MKSIQSHARASTARFVRTIFVILGALTSSLAVAQTQSSTGILLPLTLSGSSIFGPGNPWESFGYDNPGTVPVTGNVVYSGTLTFTVRNVHILWDEEGFNQHCSTKYGTAVLLARDHSAINMQVSGIGCSDGIYGMDTLTYAITTGTGRFLNVIGGTGTIAYSWDARAATVEVKGDYLHR